MRIPLVLLFATLWCVAASAQTPKPVQNVERAITILDATIERSFRGDANNLYMADVCDVDNDEVSGPSDVWPYTAAIEAHCSVLEALDELKGLAPNLYAANHDRLVKRLDLLIKNLDYYRGSYQLTSYASKRTWNVYAVPRGSAPNKGKIAGADGKDLKQNVYDDQMWLSRELIRAYRLTGNKSYLDIATHLVDYVLDGWDSFRDENGEEFGGITWGPGYNSKHACSNSPVIQPLVWLHQIYAQPKEKADYTYYYRDAKNKVQKKQVKRSDIYLQFAEKIYKWQKSHLLDAESGVYHDMLGADGDLQYNAGYRSHVHSHKPSGRKHPYNAGTMLAGAVELQRATGNNAYAADVEALSSSCYKEFARPREVHGRKFRQWPTDADALHTFNPWFNDVLMRAYVDAEALAPRQSSTESLLSFQANLDYAYEHYLRANFLPHDLLGGWGNSSKTKGFHQASYASEYAQLAIWQARRQDNTAASNLTSDDFKPYKSTNLRLPAVPLVLNDPYLSIWSPYDRLTDGETRLWTDDAKPLEGYLRVDGTTYRFMGSKEHKVFDAIAPMGAEEPWDCEYHIGEKIDGWEQPNFRPQGWNRGRGGFGNGGDGIYTRWEDELSDIYIRREVNITAEDLAADLYVIYSHDDSCNVFVNGELVGTGIMYAVFNETVKISDDVKSKLHVGKNTLAFHVRNNYAGAFADFGLYKNTHIDNPEVQTAVQKSVDVLATNTYYTFECGPVGLDLIFTAPMLIDNLDLLSTPINYISYQVRPLDGKEHDVQIFLSASPAIAVNKANQPTVSSIVKEGGITYLKAGSIDQPILAKKGDGIGIDWGYLYLPNINGEVALDGYFDIKNAFVKSGKLPKGQTGEVRSYKPSTMPSLGYVHDFGKVSSAQNSFTLIGYDEVQDIEYMYNRYKALWAHDGKVSIFDAFNNLKNNYSEIMRACRDLDKRIYDDGVASGNEHYAEILSASYRHVIAAHKLFRDNEGHLLFFSKENNSNGCVNTVDLTYPSAPLFLAYNPDLMKGMITSILEYSHTGRWTKPFAAHDLGTYPIANGQTYGGDMPIEEAGNLLIILAQLTQIDGNTNYVDAYWDILTTWADYLVENGQDPAEQLCTDDFAGHWAHNANLSIKAIMGVAGYSQMARIKGDNAAADKYLNRARAMAIKWEADARDGDHYRLAFDRPDTWSQKYNLVWDKIWGTKLFPSGTMEREISYYLGKQNKYGLPLDIRRGYTKTDWIMWSATMAADNAQFLQFVEPIYTYINETTSRVPISDWHETETGKMVGFKARSVIGGYWMKVFADKQINNLKK